MLFNSYLYLLLFLPLVWIGYVLLARAEFRQGQFLWLCLTSLLFYAYWNPVYIFLIISSIVANFFLGKTISNSSGSRAKLLLIFGVSSNLLLLGYYKYSGFFVQNLNELFQAALPVPDILLPLAISFFTFQQIAYLVDVYRGEARDYSFLHYSLFITFFPQLIAGPIVHHKEVMPQFDAGDQKSSRLEDMNIGLTFIAIGLFKKVVIADSLATVTDPVFLAAENGQPLSFAEAWIATIGFSLQLYFDFSGYCDIAIGSARLFGIRLPENFYSPYKATSIIDFWRRWHITLSRFLKDYLYISLGGNRLGGLIRYRNLLITMLLGGLWHGASWNFVIWGGLHGLYLCINHGYRFIGQKTDLYIGDRPLMHLPNLLLTFSAASFAFIYFRADSIDGAHRIIEQLISFDGLVLTETYNHHVAGLTLTVFLQSLGLQVSMLWLAALPVLFALFVVFFLPNGQDLMRNFRPVLSSSDWGNTASRHLCWQPTIGWALFSSLLLFCALLNIGSVTEFIYFQF